MNVVICEGLNKQDAARPSLPIVVASVVCAAVIWVPICLYAGHVVWFW